MVNFLNKNEEIVFYVMNKGGPRIVGRYFVEKFQMDFAECKFVSE